MMQRFPRHQLPRQEHEGKGVIVSVQPIDEIDYQDARILTAAVQ